MLHDAADQHVSVGIGDDVDIDFDGVANQRPIVVDPRYSGGWTVNNPNTSQQTLPGSAFRRATPDDNIDDLVGRNTYFTDGFEQVDAGLYKTFRAPAGGSVVLRFDLFNVFNHTTWGFPTNDFASANFGRILGTNINYQARTFQVGARYIF
jgi:hypothetical protein